MLILTVIGILLVCLDCGSNQLKTKEADLCDPLLSFLRRGTRYKVQGAKFEIRERDVFWSVIFSIEPPFQSSSLEHQASSLEFANLVLFIQIAGNNNNMSKRKQVKKD